LGIPFRGLIHDNSKFLPSEWKAYVNYYEDQYYNINNRNLESPCRENPVWIDYKHNVEMAFDKAQNHHQNRNPHHWQYWLYKNSDVYVCTPMPESYIREMIADWQGINKANGYNGDIISWYAENKDKIVLYSQTRLRVEELIGWHK
jgi:hypothetical protein